MKLRRVMAMVAVTMGAIGFAPQVSAADTWGQPKPVEFAAGVMNANEFVVVLSVSCASAGNCTAVGGFMNASGGIEAFTTRSVNGVWGQAVPAVFAAGVQSSTPSTTLSSVSCASAGNCTAVGSFANASGGTEVFTLTSVNGVWGQATPAVFAAGAQNSTPNTSLRAVSCASAGNCTAAGSFKNASGEYEAFTLTSVNGVWGQATPAVFAAGTQNVNPSATLTSVSCASAGNCTAVGYFSDASGGQEAFTMSSVNGVWGQAVPAVFAAGVRNSDPDTDLSSVSCASAGNCTAVGDFKNASGGNEAFTMSSVNGVWGQGTPAVFAAGVQNSTPSATFDSVSCASAGNCTAVGYFTNASGGNEAFTLTSVNGLWGQAVPAVFVAGVQSSPPRSYLLSVSCASAGNCIAVGNFYDVSGGSQAFSLTSVNGVWGQATPAVFVAGVQSSPPNATFFSVSCARDGYCSAVGTYAKPSPVSAGVTMALNASPPTTTTVVQSTTTVVQSTTSLPSTGSGTSHIWLMMALGAIIVGTVLTSRRRLTS